YQDELGLNITAMDFRQYDNAIGRFSVNDPLAAQDFGNSPYAFAGNNPIIFGDPSGLKMVMQSGLPSRNKSLAEITDEIINSHEEIGGGGGSGGGGGGSGGEGFGGGSTIDLVNSLINLLNSSEYNEYDGVNWNSSTGDVSGFNFQDPKWENGDGYITITEAVNTWKFGLGKQNLNADIEKLDLSKIHVSDFTNGEGSTIWVNFADTKYFTNITQAVVYGNIALTLFDGNQVFVPYQDKYDFDLRLTEGSFKRDFLTMLGNMYNGFGTPFWITINGTTTIKP
ncbi:MAG: RHS repeat-associated core domain-containing protein, partial [Flavobacterium sp.]